MKRNTKYLKWNNDQSLLQITGINYSIVCDDLTEFHTQSGWSGWKVFREGVYYVEISATIARQLSRHLKFVREEMNYDLQILNLSNQVLK